ncbi:hypothetical protein V3595_27885 [Bacillus sp. CFBP9009]
MSIRELKPEDAESFNLLMKLVETKADFMLMEPGERKGSPRSVFKAVFATIRTG